YEIMADVPVIAAIHEHHRRKWNVLMQHSTFFQAFRTKGGEADHVEMTVAQKIENLFAGMTPTRPLHQTPWLSFGLMETRLVGIIHDARIPEQSREPDVQGIGNIIKMVVRQVQNIHAATRLSPLVSLRILRPTRRVIIHGS